MAWTLTQQDDGTWAWEVFQSAYGSGSGHARTLASALVRMAIVESEILEEPLSAAEIAEMEEAPEVYLQVMAPQVEQTIGKNVSPLDVDEFREWLQTSMNTS